ncbi:hypothetical protein ABZZ92_03230 [Streptomyces ardesiacus]|uniref:hypothetical protein n=1 Tax=Streptomyces ardesiacus TaxID=285564 RepID=UPI0033A0FBE2
MGDAKLSSLRAEKWGSTITVWGPILAAAFLTVRNVINAVWSASGWVPAMALFIAGLVFLRLEQGRHQSQRMEEKLAQILEATCAVTRYGNSKEFYGALNKAVKEEAQHLIRASYFRRVPPTNEKAAKEYFKTCVSWANARSDRKLLRVMVEPSNEPMRSWVDEQREQNRPVRKGAYRLKYTQAIAEADALSIAVIDEKIIFCAFTTDDETVRGFSLTSSEIGSCFAQYHQNLFMNGKEVF